MSKQSDARYQAALALARAGKAAEARRALEDAHRHDPRHQGIRNALAVLRLEAGDAAGAVALLERLVRELPQAAALQLNYGNALLATGDSARSIKILERAAKSAPENPLVWYGLGRAQQTAGDPESAIASYRAVIRLKPDHADAHSNLSAAYTFLGNFDAAETEARHAISLVPTDPGARLNLAIALLSQGNWAEGWAAYEARFDTVLFHRQRRRPTAPRWSGTGRPGDVIVIQSEQGFGDTIQFCRLIRHLRDRGYITVLQCPEPLVGLLTASAVADSVVPFGAPLPVHQWNISLLSLPHELAIHDKIQLVGDGRPYLHPPHDGPSDPYPWSASTKQRVGIVWAGSNTHVNDRHRSLDTGIVLEMLQAIDVCWVSLQLERDDLPVPPTSTYHVARPYINTFSDTARIIASLDAVVSVDTAVAHLAGAIGMPTFLLLPHVGTDWRWTSLRAEQWYSTCTPIVRPHTAAAWVPMLRQRLVGPA